MYAQRSIHTSNQFSYSSAIAFPPFPLMLGIFKGCRWSLKRQTPPQYCQRAIYLFIILPFTSKLLWHFWSGPNGGTVARWRVSSLQNARMHRSASFVLKRDHLAYGYGYGRINKQKIESVQNAKTLQVNDTSITIKYLAKIINIILYFYLCFFRVWEFDGWMVAVEGGK